MNQLRRRDPFGDSQEASTDQATMPAMPQKKKPGAQPPPPMLTVPPPAQMGPFQPLPQVNMRAMAQPQAQEPQGGMDLQALLAQLMGGGYRG